MKHLESTCDMSATVFVVGHSHAMLVLLEVFLFPVLRNSNGQSLKILSTDQEIHNMKGSTKTRNRATSNGVARGPFHQNSEDFSGPKSQLSN